MRVYYILLGMKSFLIPNSHQGFKLKRLVVGEDAIQLFS
jgi:hypothetical protein